MPGAIYILGVIGLPYRMTRVAHGRPGYCELIEHIISENIPSPPRKKIVHEQRATCVRSWAWRNVFIRVQCHWSDDRGQCLLICSAAINPGFSQWSTPVHLTTMAPAFIQNLIPRREKTEREESLFQTFRSLTFVQWALFFSGWLAWTCDAIDFFSVSLSVSRLQVAFNRSTNDLVCPCITPSLSDLTTGQTTSITLTLLFRSLGAVVFGVISDRYGRKWPLVGNLLLCSALELGSSFVQTYTQFLALRSLFGVAMGGIWGLSPHLAASTALENMPVAARGVISGVLQQGYAVGYLIAAVVNLGLVPHNPHSWRALFWFGSAVSFVAAVIRSLLPESAVFLRAKAARKEAEAREGEKTGGPSKTKVFLRETGHMLKSHWLLCIYAVLLMAGFNFLSHGSQDLYPTYLQESKLFTPHQATIATIIGNCGAIAGGVFAGYVSQYIGRRLTIIIFVFVVGAFIPLWILPDGFSKLAAGAFCLQFGVQGAWGVVPIFLAEMSPPAFRATFPGVAYQLGNMISSASAQIEATGGEHLRTTAQGKDVPDYAKVQGIFLGCVAAYLVVVTIFGPDTRLRLKKVEEMIMLMSRRTYSHSRPVMALLRRPLAMARAALTVLKVKSPRSRRSRGYKKRVDRCDDLTHWIL
ncbi:carboxylic acid transporter [Rhizoctonia solani AG-1 IA]|uniref:Carboxylic acid transporter n=1 Tax=Thanatephorus cucumeris (strain AG1-IA) TaxID=983506 RepID=L8WTU0_THACA|nr:carboxylic acid transporter [Rhizoctonia solani AG-1 IA]